MTQVIREKQTRVLRSHATRWCIPRCFRTSGHKYCQWPLKIRWGQNFGWTIKSGINMRKICWKLCGVDNTWSRSNLTSQLDSPHMISNSLLIHLKWLSFLEQPQKTDKLWIRNSNLTFTLGSRSRLNLTSQLDPPYMVSYLLLIHLKWLSCLDEP